MKCRICHNEFKPARANQLYCSAQCRRQAQNKRTSSCIYRSRHRQVVSSKEIRKAVKVLIETGGGFIVGVSDVVCIWRNGNSDEIEVCEPDPLTRIKAWKWQEYDEDTLVALIHSAITDILLEQPKIRIRKIAKETHEPEYDY